jgi:hypothetical protein
LHSRAGVKSLVQFALALANVLQQSCLLKRPKFIFTDEVTLTLKT